MAVTEKTCKECQQVKSIENFYIHKVEKGKSYFKARCRTCCKELYANDPVIKKYRKENKLKKRYGISLETYQDMKNTQNNLCAICDSPQEGRELCVDHCHSSGKVRQLLCTRCNLILGRMGDDVGLFERCILYLNTHNKPT